MKVAKRRKSANGALFATLAALAIAGAAFGDTLDFVGSDPWGGDGFGRETVHFFKITRMRPAIMNLCLVFEGTGQGVVGKITYVTRLRDLCMDNARQKPWLTALQNLWYNFRQTRKE